MDVIRQLVDFILHIDIHLAELIARYGTGTLVLLFLIVFAETGLVVTPFLPGDSLLFAAGAFAARGALDIGLLVPILLVAAILGDTVNYWIGHKIGRRAFSGKIPFIKQEYLQRTESFYERHGGKTIILARFVPIIRTFAPFVAGIGTMSYARFIVYNVVGAVLWVVLFTVGGYFFGNLPMVQRNFKLVILAIIVVSVMPIVVEFVRARRATPA
ncbi:MAG: DedA family protein [Gemmatimonadales bacterium]